MNLKLRNEALKLVEEPSGWARSLGVTASSDTPVLPHRKFDQLLNETVVIAAPSQVEALIS